MRGKLPEGHAAALKALAKKLRGVDWALIGSANLALQGIDIVPNDIDMLTTRQGIKEVEEILKGFVVKPMHYKESDRMRSYFAVFEVNGIKIEAMDSLEVNVSGSWENTSDLSKKGFVELDGAKIPVMGLERELLFYSKAGRGEKARLIREFLEKAK